MRKLFVLFTGLVFVLGLSACGDKEAEVAIDGTDGINGTDGLSTYELYLENHPDYTGDEQQWLDDLTNGLLGEIQKWAVTFDYNDVSTSTSIVEISNLSKVLEPTSPIREGYQFHGWYSGSEQWSFLGFIVSGDVTLVAKWEPIHYEISYFGYEFGMPGYNVESPDTYEGCTYDEVCNHPVPETREGYNFLGWYTTDDVLVEDGQWSFVSDVDLYAKYEPNTYMIIFSTGTDEIIDTLSFDYNQELSILNPASREGYIFMGWFTDELYQNEFTSNTMPATNLNLYAKWDVIEVWDGSIQEPSSLVSIDGVFYYEISNGSELAYLSQANSEWLNYNYVLVADIKLNDVIFEVDVNGNMINDTSNLNEWMPINSFNGIFEGNNFTISGLFINKGTDTINAIGLFGNTSGEYYNLHVRNAYVNGNENVGGIFGTYSSSKGMYNISFDGTVVGTKQVGGIFGYYSGDNVGEIYNYGDVYATGNEVGGIMGVQSNWSAQGLYNYGKVTGNNYVGGIAGISGLYSISNSENHGNISGKDYVGGIFGYDQKGSYSNSNYGSVVGNNYVGGIAGKTDIYSGIYNASIGNSNNYGNVSGTSYVGGIVGEAISTNIARSISTGIVEADSFVGGIAGYSDSVWGNGEITDSFYLKDDALGINLDITALGNTDSDIVGLYEARDSLYFE